MLSRPPQDPRLGEELREEALGRVEANASRDWMRAAFVVGRKLATTLENFTTDHIWEQLPPSLQTHEPRAMGAVMRSLAQAGLVERTDRTVNSHRPECHRRPVRLWRSLARTTT